MKMIFTLLYQKDFSKIEMMLFAEHYAFSLFKSYHIISYENLDKNEIWQ